MTFERLLSDLSEREDAVVCEIRAEPDIKRRLYDLGFIKGSHVVCAFKSPLGDPVAYYLKGTLIVLRHQEASKIIVE